MSKYVRETKAGKSISAAVILNPKGKHVATVQAHYSDGGTVLVNVRHTDGKTDDQHGRAGGGGYDKFTAALSRMVVDGHQMADHCDKRLEKPEGLDHFPDGFAPPAGYSLANYRHGGSGYQDCYRYAGLRYLEAVGYTVINAI